MAHNHSKPINPMTLSDDNRGKIMMRLRHSAFAESQNPYLNQELGPAFFEFHQIIYGKSNKPSSDQVKVSFFYLVLVQETVASGDPKTSC